MTSEVMIARATYGDPSGFNPATRHFGAFQRGAIGAGFSLRGGYHNLVRGDAGSMRRQVDYFRRELDAYGCQWAMVDIERYQELISNDLWPRFADVLRFRDAWHAVDSRPLAYYLPRWLHNGYYGGANLRELPGPLVQSHYAGGTSGSAARIYANAGGDHGTGWDDAYGNRLPDIWQFTSDADVDGASSVTDANAFRGTVDQLRSLLTGDDDMSWDERLGQGPAGSEYANHMARTAVAWTWAGVDRANEALKRLEAATAAEQTRDAASAAAIQALTELVRSGGGGDVDATAILERIDAKAAETQALVQQRHQAEMAELQRLHAEVLRERDAQIQALRAELSRLEGGQAQA
ncbi:hypothetical protein [Allorhizocola rhizosphaerae]|uniref:hypothetical protein n=1 Tax=Allorhizocola rhizosphaerae TaxID=1872709 RepID=UPI0013C34E29|nr:hypothetical protein [Allorhizocola rhizosphaerae]